MAKAKAMEGKADEGRPRLDRPGNGQPTKGRTLSERRDKRAKERGLLGGINVTLSSLTYGYCQMALVSRAKWP